MRKTLGKRLISGVTSALMTISLAMPNGLIGSVGEQLSAKAAGPVATLTGEDMNANSMMGTVPVNAADASVRLKFRTTRPSANPFSPDYGKNQVKLTMADDDNEYYIIAHAVTADTYTADPNRWGFFPVSGEFPYEDSNREFYGLYEVCVDDATDFKHKLDFLPTVSVEVAGSEKIVAPDIVTLDFTVVKNKGTEELTAADIGDTSKYDEVDMLKGMTLSSDNKLTNINPIYGTADYCIEIKAEGGHTVKVGYYDFNGTDLKPVETDDTANYYVLSKLKKDGKTVAYSADEIKPEENAESYVYLWEFKEIDEDGVETGNIITYDPSIYTLDTEGEKIRVYHTMTKEQTIEKYAGFSDPALATSEVIAPYISVSNDTVGNVTTITAKKEHVTYDLKLVFDDDASISAAKNYYILLDTLHQSGGHTYYFSKLELDGSSNEYVIPIQTKDKTNWKYDNGISSRFSGGEQSVTAKIYAGKDDTKIDNIKNGEAAEVEIGDPIEGYNFVSADTSFDTKTVSTDEDGQKTASYTATLNFKKVDF